MRMLALIVAVLMLAVPVRSDTDLERSFDVESGQTLTVELDTGGDITITGWDKDVVDVKVIYDAKDKERIEVDMRRIGSGVDISSEIEVDWGDTYRYTPDLEIMVPLKFNLDLHTMGGDIEIDNVEGEISGLTMGGDLDLKYLKGDIALKTMGGDITCRDSDLDGSVNTMGGKVLMRNLVGDVKGSSMGGHVIYENVTSRDGATTGDVVNITTMGGDINVNVAPKGAKVSTMGGDIEIRSANEFVRAKTMGGDIEIEEVDGWVKATTMGGSIEVTVIGDPDRGDRSVSLTSMAGDVELTVPAGLSMELDLELAYTKGNEGDFDIHSDFDFEREETEEWDKNNGSPRRYIYGKGSVKGGKHRIRIKTINGDIYLNRGR